MKIFFMICSMANSHGLERTLTDKINYLADHGHDVTLVTYEQGQHDYPFKLSPRVRCTDLNCRFFTLYRYTLLKRYKKMWSMKRRFRKTLQQLIEKDKPDLLVTTTYEGDFMTQVMTLRHMVKIVVEAHTAFTHDIMSGNLLKKTKNRFYLSTLKKSHLLISLTQADAAYWEKHINNVLAVPNPVSFYPCSLSNSKRREGRIISAGRYHAQKRFDRLIDAFHLIADQCPDWYIDIYGEGSEKEILQKQIDQMGLRNRIHLMPPTKDIFTEYQSSQFFAFSSDYEGFGLVLTEAMACGLPVVTTNCQFGPSEIVNDGVTGLLTRLEVNDLAEKLLWMITHDVERQQMAVKAHEAAAAYEMETVMKKWEEAYQSVCKDHTKA